MKQCGNLRNCLPLRFYVKSILRMVGVQKLLFLLLLEALNFYLGKFLPSQFALKNHQEPQKCQNGNLWSFYIPKNWFHVHIMGQKLSLQSSISWKFPKLVPAVKFELQKNSWIGALCAMTKTRKNASFGFDFYWKTIGELVKITSAIFQCYQPC